MNYLTFIRQACVWLVLLFTCSHLAAAHEHIAAGVTDNGQLQFVSGYASGTVFHLLPATGSLYQGYYSLSEQIRADYPNDYFTFVALSDGQTDDAQPHHAPTGTDIWVQITSVSGPAGASFGFWEAGWAQTHQTPTASFLTNTPTGGYKFEISEPLYFVAPEDQDPYGHIHGRAWTVDTPGDYTIGFTLYDLSTVGPNGGPLEAPSQTYLFHFQAIPEPGAASLLLLGSGAFWRPRHSSRRPLPN